MLPSNDVILVTGASGFIGRRLVSYLLKQDLRVRVLVRPGRAPDGRIPAGCEQVEAGLTDVKGLEPLLVDCAAVIYCAGTVRGRAAKDFATANIRGVEALVEALQIGEKPPPVLLLSSLAASRPQVSDYANSKYLGEQVLRNAATLPWTIFRPPAVYGPGDTEMLPLLKWIRRGIMAHAGPRDQRLSLLHVDDLVTAIVAWFSTTGACEHQCYAIDDGTRGGYDWQAIGEAVGGRPLLSFRLPTGLLQAAASINLQLSKLLGYQPMLSPGKARELVQDHWLCENREFTQATGWRPAMQLKEGVKTLL